MDEADRPTAVEIRLLALEPAGYPVELRVTGAEEYPRGYAAPLALAAAGAASPADRGHQILAALLADDALRASWAAVRSRYPQHRLRLRIDPDAAELHALPWEELAAGQTCPPAADPNTPFARYAAGPWPATEPLTKPLRMLRVTVAPVDCTDYGFAPPTPAPAADTGSVTGPAALPCLDPGPGVTPAILSELLADDVHLLHLTTHSVALDSGRSAFALADERNRTLLLDEDELAELLLPAVRGSTLRGVLLATCRGVGAGVGDAGAGLAGKLAAAGLPAVLGFAGVVGAAWAGATVALLLRRLVRHGHLERATNELRAVLRAERTQPAVQPLPVLFSRLADGRLFRGEE